MMRTKDKIQERRNTGKNQKNMMTKTKGIEKETEKQ